MIFKVNFIFLSMTALTILTTVTQQSQAVIIVSNQDIISESSRTSFNGFEAVNPIEKGIFNNSLTTLTYIEDNIRVEQVNRDLSADGGMFVTYDWTGKEGNYAWYPNGGDNGYTVLSLADEADFQSVGFNYGTGSVGNFALSRENNILYELLNDAQVVLSGLAPLDPFSVNYLGFSGGGFDTIRLRDTAPILGETMPEIGTVTDGSFQTLAIDNIEVISSAAAEGQPSITTPEPSTIIGLGILTTFGIGTGFKRKLAKTKNK